MADQLRPGLLASLDERRTQALLKAGVDTVDKLAQIDPDAVAEKAQLSGDELRRLKAEATASLRRPQPTRVTRRPRVVAWVILALVFISVISLWYAARTPGRLAREAAQYEQALIKAAEHFAAMAESHVSAAGRNVSDGNWGTAQRDLDQGGEYITKLEEIAVGRLAPKVLNLRARLGDAQRAVGGREAAAAQHIARLRQTLAEIAGIEE